MPRSRSRVTGYKQTARNLRTLSRSMQGPIGIASRAALRPMLAEAKQNLRTNGSVKRGVLLRGMVIRKNKRSLRGTTSWMITASGRAVGIAHLVEFGTEPHFQPKRGVMHPGARPKPFLSPAFYDREDDAVRVYRKTFMVELEKKARALHRGGRSR